MIRPTTQLILALILAWVAVFWAAMAWSEPMPCGRLDNGDRCSLHESRLGHPAELVYLNAVQQTSRSLDAVELTYEDVTVRIWVEVDAGEGGGERITVQSDDGWPVPPEAIVLDGEEVVIQIVRDLF